jgi:hypothetical protein
MANMLSRQTMENILRDVQIVLLEGPLLIMHLFMQIALLIVQLNGLLLGNSLLGKLACKLIMENIWPDVGIVLEFLVGLALQLLLILLLLKNLRGLL